ncbi:hypothetical protein C8D97_111132 [Pleionea mediterranea]|uniref:Uncharacterized protein n=1 Tax=Pleionea mediterranea TaxID=523701 RepID=A0A316FZ21_9GAMM|nr:hypothetical protein C8D97_111132 [Pleionea mediterranea]
MVTATPLVEDCEREYFVFNGKSYEHKYVVGNNEFIDSTLEGFDKQSDKTKFILDKFL